MRKTIQYLAPTKTGYKLISRRIGERTPKTKKISIAERFFALWLLVFTGSITLGAWIGSELQTSDIQVQAKEEVALEVTTDAGLELPEPTPTPEPTPIVVEDAVDQKMDKQQILSYIHEVFGEQGELAVAVGMSESHLIPEKTLIAKAGKHDWSSDTYKGECSIGLFMINLSSDACNGKKVHYDKVPGDTLEEKIEWLKDPKNNTDFAKDIYDSRGNFSAWSGYTGGGYEKFIK